MKVAVFNTKPYDEEFLARAARDSGHELEFFEARLIEQTAPLAGGFPAVCVFVNDVLDRGVLEALAEGGTRLVALRCAGFNNVDLAAAAELGMTVVRVPAYSPHAVAEHTIGLILALNRKIHRAYRNVREGNFALDGFLGFDLRGRKVGVIGTGRIGEVVVKILAGFECQLLVQDPVRNPVVEGLGAKYVTLEEIFRESDVISLHCPLTPQTHHLIDDRALSLMKPGVMIINTSRGALIDTPAAIAALKSGRIGYLGLDVYEEEADLFFEDLSNRVLQDDVFSRLLTFPNVIVTGHQAFFTEEALRSIAETTVGNITAFEAGEKLENEVHAEQVIR